MWCELAYRVFAAVPERKSVSTGGGLAPFGWFTATDCPRCAAATHLPQVASGEVKEEELSVYFYANKRSPNGELQSSGWPALSNRTCGSSWGAVHTPGRTGLMKRACVGPWLPLDLRPAVCHLTLLCPAPPRFAGAPNCCTCVKAAGNNTTAGAAKDNAETNTTDATGDTKAGSGDNETKAGDGNEDDGSGDKKGSKGGSDDGSKKNNEEEEGGKKKGGEDDEKKGTRPGNYTRNNATAPAKPVTPAGVYLFAQTFITNFTEEQVRPLALVLAQPVRFVVG